MTTNLKKRKSKMFSFKTIAKYFAVLNIIFLIAPSMSNATALNSVNYASLPGDKVEIRFGFDSVPPKPQGYNIEKPARIALDLPGVSSELRTKYHELGIGNARNLTVIESGSRTRIIINLSSLESYSTKISHNDLVLVIGQPSDEGKPMSEAIVSDSSVPFVKEKMIKDVDFKRGINGEGKVVIELSDSSIPVDMRREGGKILLKFGGAKLPEALVRRLDVIDFATPVKEIDSTNEASGALVIIKPIGDYEHLAYQTDNKFVVSVKPLSVDELEKKKHKAFAFSGEKLSLNFQDIEVRSVLQLIADFTELNLVASDTVSGKITLRLQNVPWDQALDLILKTKGLDKRKIGNVMLVAPADEIAAREKLELEAGRQVAALAPMQSEFFTIKYAAAKDISDFISGEGSKLISLRGGVILDSRTNTLLIQDTVQKLEEIRNVIERLDVPVKQVLIEARVVVASTNISNELGVRWGGTGFKDYDPFSAGGLNHISGSEEQSTHIIDRVSSTINNPTGPERSSIWPGSYVVDFGASDPNATSMNIGFVAKDGILNLELSAIEAEGDGEVISTPKILTADAQEAEIMSGKKIPILISTSSGATAVSYIDAVLGLTVTPHITPDDRILMDLHLTQDSIAEFIDTGDPIIDVNEITTHVLVGNGDTVVLGGVFKTVDSDQIFKTPFFGDLPVIGRLFRKTTSLHEKQELLIFITPKIIEDLLAVN